MFNLLVGWALMYAFYVAFMRGYKSPVPAKLVRFEYRRKVGKRFGLLPPSFEPIGIALWILTGLGFVAAIVFFLVGDRFIGASNATMLGAFLVTLWRDDQWLKGQPNYVEAVAAASPSADSDDE